MIIAPQKAIEFFVLSSCRLIELLVMIILLDDLFIHF